MSTKAEDIINDAKKSGSKTSGDGGGGKKDNVAEKVVKALSLAGVKLWHNQDGDSYATVRRPNPGDKEHSHIENHKVETRIFKNLVRLIYRDAISQKAMADVIGSLNAHALDGECRKPAIRSMRHAGGLVVDLGTDDWRMVEITADGWRVVP